MQNYKSIGWLLVIGAIAVLIPYTILTIIFDYPNVLRLDTGVILSKIHEGGSKLIATWFAFAVAGLPLIPAYILLGQRIENKSGLTRVATTIGLIGLIVQVIGLLRWTFVVPVLSDSFIHAANDAERAAAVMSFKMIHQFAGVLLGEHLGQLFTITWTVLISISFAKQRLMPTWVNWLAFISAGIYILAQLELFATVIPGFPVIDIAGFLGSTLWLVWLVIVGVRLIRKK